VSSGQISDLVNSIGQAKKVSLEGQARGVAISQLQNQFQIIGDSQDKINNALLHTDNIVSFVNALKAIATKNSIQQSYSFSSPTPYTSQEGQTFYSVSFNISLAGDIDTFIQYLNDFNNLPYFTNISSINISSPSGVQHSSSMNMVATLYIQQ